MHDLLVRLFPICRSLTGNGVRETLRVLDQELRRGVAPLSLQVHEIASGTKCFDWTVPDEWNIRDAYIKEASSGRRIVDFQKSNLHVVGYSVAFDGKLPLAKLKPHLHFLPDQPDAIPYVTSYYSRQWGFCLTHRKLKKLKEQVYDVKIDSSLAPGHLTYADMVIPGQSQKEIFFSTYVCHPSMANNELSGPIVATYLAKAIAERRARRYTYRFVFVPETIGAIAYLSRHKDELKARTAAGYVITCVGDPGPFSYLESRTPPALVDRVTLHILKSSGERFKTYSYLHRGSDERQYGAPGIDLPVGSLMRTKYGVYPEYHTSLDDERLVTPDALAGSLDMYLRCVDALEANRTYRATVFCEPQLGKRGLYPNLSMKGSADSVKDMMDLLAYSDGRWDLLAIADKVGRPISSLAPIVRKLTDHGLLEAVD